MQDNKSNETQYIEIGKIVNTHGIAGNVKVNMYTEDLLDIKKYENIYLKENKRVNSLIHKLNIENKEKNKEKTNRSNADKYINIKIEKISKVKNQVILKIENIDKIEEAEYLRDSSIYITKEELEEKNELNEDEYYLVDLIGIDVYDVDLKINIGNIIDIQSYTQNDIYIVETNEEYEKLKQNKNIKQNKKEKPKDKSNIKKQILIPAVKEYILEVDLENNLMKIKLGGLDEI